MLLIKTTSAWSAHVIADCYPEMLHRATRTALRPKTWISVGRWRAQVIFMLEFIFDPTCYLLFCSYQSTLVNVQNSDTRLNSVDLPICRSPAVPISSILR